METIVCDLCRQNSTRTVYHVQDTNYGTPGEFILVQCRACGLVYLNPRPTAEELPQRYPSRQYDPFAAIYAAGVGAPTPTQEKRVAWLTRALGPGRVLDVGCGDGGFLAAMQAAGWACAGVEPHTPAVDHARQALRLDVVAGDIHAWPDGRPFDLITFWDVLEHTPSPTRALARAHQLIARDGRLVVSVPNWDSVERLSFGKRWIALDAPRHFYHFSHRTLGDALQRSGFRAVQWQAASPPHSLASNGLRLAGDLAFRRGQAKALTAASALAQAPSAGRRRLIRAAHALASLPNWAFNLLQRGADLTVIARVQ